MTLRRLACCSPLLLILACGGGKAPDANRSATTTANTPLAVENAEAMTTTFLLAEQHQMNAPALPSFVPKAAAGVFGLMAPPSIPDCVTVTPNGAGSVLLTFNGCVGPNGGTLNGRILFSWKASEYTLNFQDLQAARGTQAWLLNGTRTLQLNAALKTATAVTTGMRVAFTDSAAPASNKTVLYASNLTSDWNTAGVYKLWGTFSAQKGADPTSTGTITAAAPLAWNAGCCHPDSGALVLQQGLAKAELTFGQPCGTLTITPFGQSPVTKTLPACP